MPQEIFTLSDAGRTAMGKLLNGRLIEGRYPAMVSYGGDRYIVQVEQQTSIGKITGIAKTQYYVDGAPVPAFVLNVSMAEGNGVALLDPTAIPFRVDTNGKWVNTGDYVLLDNMLDYNTPVALQQADTVLYTDQACTTTLKAIVYTCMVQPTINQATTMQVGALANQVSGVFASASADEWTSTYLFGKPKAMTGVVLDKDDYTLTSKTMQDFPISVELFSDALNEEWKRDFALYIIGKKTPATRDLESETIPTYVAPIVYLPCICVESSSSVSASTPCEETCTEPAVTITLAGITKTDAGDTTEVNGKFTLANVNGGSMYTGGGSGFRISATKTVHGWQITVIKGSVGNYGGVYYATTYNYLPAYDMQCTGTEAENGLRESGIIIGGAYNAGYGGTALVECEYCACKPAETDTVTVSFRNVVFGDDRYIGMGWNPNRTFVLGDLEASSDLSTFWNCHATAGTWKKFFQYGNNGAWVEIPPPYTTANREAPVVAIIASVYQGKNYVTQTYHEYGHDTGCVSSLCPEDGWVGTTPFENGYFDTEGDCMIVCGTASVSASASTSASQSASVSVSQSASISTSVSTSISASQSVSVSTSTSVNNDCQPPWEAGILVCYDGQNWWNWQQQNGEVRIYYLGGDDTKDYIQSWFGEWQNSIGNPITGIDCGACPSVSTSASVSASVSASYSASVSHSASTSHSGSISASASSSGGGACAPTGPYTPSFVRYAGLRCDGMGEGSGCYTYNGYNGYTSQSLRYITNASDYYSWYNLTANVGEWYRYESSNDSWVLAEGIECGPVAPSSLCHAGTLQLDFTMDQNGAFCYASSMGELYLWLVYDAATFNAQFDPPTNFTNGQFVESYPGWLDVHTDVTEGAC